MIMMGNQLYLLSKDNNQQVNWQIRQKMNLHSDLESLQEGSEQVNFVSTLEPLLISKGHPSLIPDCQTQINIISSYLTLSAEPVNSTLQIVDREVLSKSIQVQDLKFIDYVKNEDEEYDYDGQPKRKASLKRRRQRKAKKSKPFHNTFAQIFRKLLRCFQILKRKIQIPPQIFHKRDLNYRGLCQFLKDPKLFDIFIYIFETNMWVDEVLRGKALLSQKLANISEIKKIKDRFEQEIKLWATIFKPLQNSG